MLRLLEATPTERAAKLTHLLASGERLTTEQAAEAVGVSVRSAERTLFLMSRVVPIYQDDDGSWLLISSETPTISPI